MTKQIAIIVDKSCDICLYCDVPDYTDNLICLKTLDVVEDNFVCEKFEICKEVLSDTFFKIKEVRDYEL